MEPEPTVVYVDHLDDLMSWDDYRQAHQKVVVRLRLTVTDDGVDILGDSPYPAHLETILAALAPETLEMMLCG